jgi:phage tail sheath protein FI
VRTGPLKPRLVASFTEYLNLYGANGPFLPDAVRGFFENGGTRAFICRLRRCKGGQALDPDAFRRGLAAMESPAFDDVALVAAPGTLDVAMTDALAMHCETFGRFAIFDGPRDAPRQLAPQNLRETSNAACYAPWLEVDGRFVPPSGHVVGIYARTDAARGVWKAPANEVVKGATALEHALGDGDQDAFAARRINAIRAFAGRGIRVWGARTMAADPEWKYVSVRRLFLFLERSIGRGTKWVVFEANDVRLWTRVRALIENFLVDLWRAGALMGMKPQEAFYVRCDRTTMTADDIASGRLICEIGIAPVRAAEFIILRIGQWTRDADP